ncbi:M23 family metallopeptidase [Calothrix sp. 336/3]|uniref:M23 family metallopeptidase n=1 Tax=Calothrix sp. 336/3 TaxID=1337936 RepID=UPI0004E2F59A|nr:M23 family metallopeptidase [Calothrix sp. 336/3]AKG23913.1 peptidase M23 [Calothrix sp. 336/3]
MTQRQNSDKDRPPQPWHKSLPAQSLCLLGSVSLLGSSGLVVAQAESAIDNIVPTAEQNSVTAPVKKDTVERVRTTAAPEPSAKQPEFSQRRTRLSQKLRRKPQVAQVKNSTPETLTRVRNWRQQVEISQPKVESSENSISQEKPQVEINTPTSRQDSPEKLPTVAQPSGNNSSNSTAGKPKDYNNTYIDPTDYSAENPGKYQAPDSVVVTERNSNCRAVLGQGVASNSCVKTPVATEKKATPTWLRNSQLANIANAGSNSTMRRNGTWQGTRVIPNGVSRAIAWNSRLGNSPVSKSSYNPNRFIPTPSNFYPTTTVSATPLAPTAGTLSAPITEEGFTPRASTVAYNIPLASTLPRIAYAGRVPYSGSGLMYPLSVASPITSLFGWRTHPITGDRRFHAGIDIGAAMGTPVLAAYTGQVEIADWVGGYGMTVVLNHNNAQQTLYGHMSAIFVQPGQWVEKGTVIGQVGSTGNSTGPHLHFEVRQLTPQGWVAVDPGVELNSALSQMLQPVPTTQALRQPGS